MYLSTDLDELVSVGNDLKLAIQYLKDLPDLLDRLHDEETKSGRDAIRLEANELRGSIHARLARALFNLTRQSA